MRIGVVGFTNTLPLAHELEYLLPGADLVRDTPARIASELEAGGMDVGLVPVTTLTQNPSWVVVPGLGIASEGPVRSVLLLSRVSLSQVQTVLAEPASRTSNLLARLWLEHVGLRPEMTEGPPDPRRRLAEREATVVIGDEALFWDEETAERIDLGGAWTEWMGLPFVFAVWAGPGAGDPALVRALGECLRRNEGRLGELARLAAPGDEDRRGRVEAYLRESIRYRIAAREIEGLSRFLDLAAEAGALPAAGERGRRVLIG